MIWLGFGLINVIFEQLDIHSHKKNWDFCFLYEDY